MMGMFIDTFPAFLAWWSTASNTSLNEQIESWANDYMAQFPSLLAMQTEDYASQGVDWRRVAREKVFPFLPARLPAMRLAHQNLLELCEPLYARAQAALDFDGEVTFIIHVGIGCGAGWVTPYAAAPAILFGLENIAESGWCEAAALRGLIAHELGHLVHQSWRAQHGRPLGSGPWWQLYEEGFAQVCEGLICGAENWHQSHGTDGHWLEWCQRHEGWLAAEFLKASSSNQSVSAFFGSWFSICGRSETGYYLGWRVIQELRKHNDFRDIALLENVETTVRPVVAKIAKE